MSKRILTITRNRDGTRTVRTINAESADEFHRRMREQEAERVTAIPARTRPTALHPIVRRTLARFGLLQPRALMKSATRATTTNKQDEQQ